jgi:hypothetical protein
MGRPTGQPSRAEASGIRVPPRTSQNDGRAWPIVCREGCLRAFGAFGLVGTTVPSGAGHVPEKDRAKATGGDGGASWEPQSRLFHACSDLAE